MQLHKSFLDNSGANPAGVDIALFQGYHDVHAFLTANITTSLPFPFKRVVVEKALA